MTAIDRCLVCSNPDAATWRERFAHGCSKPGEVWRCVWCGEPHLVEAGTEMLHRGAGGHWCSENCMAKHKVANPDCEWFRGFLPVEDTLPGGRFDGVWEESGFSINPRVEPE